MECSLRQGAAVLPGVIALRRTPSAVANWLLQPPVDEVGVQGDPGGDQVGGLHVDGIADARPRVVALPEIGGWCSSTNGAATRGSRRCVTYTIRAPLVNAGASVMRAQV